MAYLELTATDLNDILTQAEAFFSTNGWTTNSLVTDASFYAGSAFSGLRLHISKSLTTKEGATTVYANLRSALGQQVVEYPLAPGTPAHYFLTGLSVNVSTGYDGGESWDQQPGAPTSDGSTSCGGMAHVRITTSIPCRFFSTDNLGAILIQGADQWYVVAFGVTSLGLPFYFSSGDGPIANSADDYASSKTALNDNGLSGADDQETAQGVLYDGDWKLQIHAASIGDNIGDMRDTSCLIGVACTNLIWYSTEQFSDNPVLSPCYAYTSAAPATYRPIVILGHIEGVTLINMINYTDGEEFAIGSDSWQVFLVSDSATPPAPALGYALLK